MITLNIFFNYEFTLSTNWVKTYDEKVMDFFEKTFGVKIKVHRTIHKLKETGKEALYLLHRDGNDATGLKLLEPNRLSTIQEHFTDLKIVVTFYSSHGFEPDPIKNDRVLTQIVYSDGWVFPCDTNTEATNKINKLINDIKKRIWNEVRLMFIGHKDKDNILGVLPTEILKEIILFIVKS